MSRRQPVDVFAEHLDARARASILDGAKSTHEARTRALDAFGGFEGLRAEAARLKRRTIADLDHHLDRAAARMRAAGVQVHFAADAAHAREIAKDILRTCGARRVVKSKSMLTEEIELNPALEAAGIECVETDLGEFIVQIDRDRPSHIVKPILHKSREGIAASFEREGLGAYDDDPETITRRARRHLRRQYLSADAGITGANFVSAESGRIVLVTNEGNARFCLAAPPVHIAFVGIEKLVRTDADLATFLRLLARSGTGQALTVYTQFVRGPAPADHPDGPRQSHVVFVDAGRRAIRDGGRADVLSCIRCGACLNVCPVYRQAGGHAYRHVYPGPIGSVLAPQLAGAGGAAFLDLPKACSTCGACGEVCPVAIPLPDLLLRARDLAHREAREVAKVGTPDFEAFTQLATHPRAWRTAMLAGHAIRIVPQALLRQAPVVGAWLGGRGLPEWRGGAFRRWWAEREGPRAPHPDLVDASSVVLGERPSSSDRPRISGDWREFRRRFEAVGGQLLTDVTQLAGALRGAGARTGYVDPDLLDPTLAAALAGFDVRTSFARADVDAYRFAVTRAVSAIAETGTVVLEDRSTPSRLAALAPWVHVVLVAKESLHADLDAALRALGEDPSVIWVTGPSKTADVEGILIEGAHGPGVQIVCPV